MADEFDRADMEISSMIHAKCQHIHNSQLATDNINVCICIDCGEDIPEVRKLSVPNCIRCTECQTIYDEEQTRSRR